jgi:uncharacterized protein YacL
MLDALIIISLIIAGIGIGFYSIDLLPERALLQVNNLEGLSTVLGAFGALIGLIVGLFAQSTFRRVEQQVRQMPADKLITRAVGLILGLLVANLMLAPIFLLPIPSDFTFIKPLAAVMGSLLFAISGVNLADAQGRSLLRLINPNSVESILLSEGTLKAATTKVLDTSCIIDGRIEDLMKTGFLEGQILVPRFVLAELQLIADSANDQKRSRGRRGLDILNRIQEGFPERIVIHSADYKEITTVDAKLVKLAQDINASLLTNDYNLNKVASLQKVMVLNINDLAQSMRSAYVPGDIMELKIVKQGKEPEQGVGYLDDGTMVVVEEGGTLIGSEVNVIVTGALQTSAGRMIFARTEASIVA